MTEYFLQMMSAITLWLDRTIKDRMLVIRTVYTKELYKLKEREFEDMLRRLDSRNK